MDNSKTIEEVKVLALKFNEIGDMTIEVRTNNGDTKYLDDKQLYTDEHMTSKFDLSKFMESDRTVLVCRNVEHKLKATLVIDEKGKLCIKGNPFFCWLGGMEVHTSTLIPVKEVLFTEGYNIWVTPFGTTNIYGSLDELEYYNERKMVNYKDGSVDIIGGQHKDFDFNDKQKEALENFKESYRKLCESGIDLIGNDYHLYALNVKGKNIYDPYMEVDDMCDVPDQAYIDLDIDINTASNGLCYKMHNRSVES